MLKEIDEMIEKIELSEDDLKNLLVSDASESHAFCYTTDDRIVMVIDHPFSVEEKSLSSSQRELRAISLTLENQGEALKKLNSPLIYWQTDSRNARVFLLKGSKLSQIQKDVLKIKILENLLGIRIIPVWTPCSHARIMLADEGSKFSSSSDEWGLDRNVLKSLCDAFNFSPTLDTFASKESTYCKKFFSKVPQVGSSGTNLLSQSLPSAESYLVCPPVTMILDALHHVESSNTSVSAVFIVPNWKSALFWPVLHDGAKFQKSIKKFLYFKPKFVFFNNHSKSFEKSNRKSFMLAFLVKT